MDQVLVCVHHLQGLHGDELHGGPILPDFNPVVAEKLVWDLRQLQLGREAVTVQAGYDVGLKIGFD